MIIIKRKRKNNIPEKILLFCILFLSYRWIFEDDSFTFAVAGLGYMALTGWVFRFGGRADQDISSESVDENPLYVYGMMRKNRKWLSGIRVCFLFQMLLLTDVFLQYITVGNVGRIAVGMMRLNNCASHSRYFSDELDAQIFYPKKEHMFTYGTICAKI